MDSQIIGWSIVGIIGVVGVGTLFKTQNKIDKFNRDAEDKFVNKDVCKILSEGMSNDIKEIKKDVKDLLKMTGNKRT